MPNTYPNQPTPGQQAARIQVKVSETKPVVCPCGCEVFSKGFLLRKVSVILGGDNEPKPYPAVYCVKCGKAVPDFLPPELRPVIEV